MAKEKLVTLPSIPTSSWKKWGPYVSERAWGSVREDYSLDGNAWNYLPHDMARYKAYRWGEEGIAGICDFLQTLVFSLSFWNEKDPFLKERLFGLTPFEGNHGEDVKELYFYLASTPTYSYMKYLYLYPQKAFPYQKLREENQKRSCKDPEYELIDTGVLGDNCYFKCFIEYAKMDVEDIGIKITILNCGSTAAPLHIIPQLYFRNQWSFKHPEPSPPFIQLEKPSGNFLTLKADPRSLMKDRKNLYPYDFSPMYLYALEAKDALFTHNETNREVLYNRPNPTPFVKDAFHQEIVEKKASCNPEKKGTKAAIHYEHLFQPGEKKAFFLRLSSQILPSPFSSLDSLFLAREKECTTFYQAALPNSSDQDLEIYTQALSGLLWSHQFYYYDVKTWLQGDKGEPLPPSSREHIRNFRWKHFKAETVISMPDKWEYPWFAAWDLAFQAVALAEVDIAFAKEQISLLLHEYYQHPNGQIPAYEWAFSDLNPPLQAWACLQIYLKEEKKDYAFLERAFFKLMQNFSWWVNRVDQKGNNIFEGGFLGLDNISILDRSKPLQGTSFEESDGTGWMGFFSLQMMQIALHLTPHRPTFAPLILNYLNHFIAIANSLHQPQGEGTHMWDEQEGFFYDLLSNKNGLIPLKVRSFVGIIPFFSLAFLSDTELKNQPLLIKQLELLVDTYPHLANCSIIRMEKGYLLSLMSKKQIAKSFEKIGDPEEFLSPYGLRSLSKYHQNHPFIFADMQVGYEPGESLEKIKGGNSNWRGPVWIPTNFLFLQSLKVLSKATENSLLLPFAKKLLNPQQIHALLKENLLNLFRKNAQGCFPIYANSSLESFSIQNQLPLLFYEHYHGDTGRGLGASHQTGWSALIALLLKE